MFFFDDSEHLGAVDNLACKPFQNIFLLDYRPLSPDFYPAYRRVKACTDGPKMPVRTKTVLYGPIRPYTRSKNQVALSLDRNLFL